MYVSALTMLTHVETCNLACMDRLMSPDHRRFQGDLTYFTVLYGRVVESLLLLSNVIVKYNLGADRAACC